LGMSLRPEPQLENGVDRRQRGRVQVWVTQVDLKIVQPKGRLITFISSGSTLAESIDFPCQHCNISHK
jgi:hypothetical protein